MKVLGLIKWFDETKGYGKIGTPESEDVFIHISNFSVKPEKLLKGTALIFETKTDKKGVSARNVEAPSSYDDFKLILSYLSKKPSITIEVTVSGKSRWGNPFKRNEYRTISIVDYSLHQLLRDKSSNEILNLFKAFFDEVCTGKDKVYIREFFNLTRDKINGLKIELEDILLEEFQTTSAKKDIGKIALIQISDKSKNRFLINKLFSHYITKIPNDALFEIWKNRTLLESSNTIDYLSNSSDTEVNVHYPPEIFINNYSLLDSHDLKRIQGQVDSLSITTEIIRLKTNDLAEISKAKIEDLFNCIKLISESEETNALRNAVGTKLLHILTQFNLNEASKTTLDSFKTFLSVIKNNLNEKEIIEAFNNSISDDTKFILWQHTRYFEPNSEFFISNFSNLSHSDFLAATEEFHKKYFETHFNDFENILSIEQFARLTLLVIETPLKVLNDIFPRLHAKYQAAYWLNFPKYQGYQGN